MPKIRVNDVELYYEESGSGPETIVFSHGFLMDHSMFRAQIAALQDTFRCIAYDHRGHGQSEVIRDAYEMDDIYNDAVALIEALDCAPCHFVGMSTGGFVGLRLGIRRPDLVKSLVLMDTSADVEESGKVTQYNLMLKTVQTIGWRPVIGRVMPILFHDNFLSDNARKKEVETWRKIVTGHDRKGVLPFGRAIFSRDSVAGQLDQIKVPTLVVVGKHDAATPLAHSQRLADQIPDAHLRVIPDAGHSAAVEKPKQVTNALTMFYERISGQ